MDEDIGQGAAIGLERSCKSDEQVHVRRSADCPGIEFMEARFFGDVFERHRHDTYAIGLTLGGVQRFFYRGEERRSVPGQALVLHPDEEHDGGAGTDAELHYRMLYLDPSLLAAALGSDTIPFVREPVISDAALAASLSAAFGQVGDVSSGLLVDDLMVDIGEGLSRHAGAPSRGGRHLPERQVRRARDFLEANLARNVHSAELEAVTGLDRFLLSRAFRAVLGTSPHRYLLMRRLHRGRMLIESGMPLAQAAIDTGFADQSHFSRHFKKAYGLTPGRWGELAGRGRSTENRGRQAA